MSSYVSLSRFTNKETLLFYILRKICVSWQPKLYPKKMSACQLKLWTIVGNTFFSLAKVKQDLHYIFITFSALHWLEHFDVHPLGQSKFNVQLPLFLAPYPRQPPSPPFPRPSTPVSTIYFPFPVFPAILHFLFLFYLCLCLFLLFLFSFLFLLIFVSLPIWTLVNF